VWTWKQRESRSLTEQVAVSSKSKVRQCWTIECWMCHCQFSKHTHAHIPWQQQSDHSITRTVYSCTGWKYAYLLIDQSYRSSSERCHHTWCVDLIASSFVGIRKASSASWLSGLSKYFRIPSVYSTNQFLFQRRRTEPFVSDQHTENFYWLNEIHLTWRDT